MADEVDQPSPAEILCGRVRTASEAVFGPDEERTLEGELIRRLVLSLPLPGAAPEQAGACQLTPYGIRIVGALIEGDVLLDRANPAHGGPLCPIEFERCDFLGRFSGAHAHFSRLNFRNCTFTDSKGPPVSPGGESRQEGRDTPAPFPTIDLRGARFDTDLHLAQLRPDAIARDSPAPRGEGNHLWIRLIGARIDGELDLCDSHLRAPPSEPHLMSENDEDALDLTLTDIRGDVQLVGFCRVQGRIKMRSAHVHGDVWMSGAQIENPGDHGLFLQGARIDGLAIFDGRFDRRGNDGPFRRFKCIGDVNLSGCDIGRGLYISHALIRGQLFARNLTVQHNVILDGEFSEAIDLSECRIGGSLDLTRTNLASSVQTMSLRNGKIGRSLTVASRLFEDRQVRTGARAGTGPSPPSGYRLIRARRAQLASFPRLHLVETLWTLEEGDEILSEGDVREERRLVQAAFLVSADGEIFHLDGHADVLEQAALRFGRPVVDRDSAAEYACIAGAHVLRPDGAFRLFEALPDKELQREVSAQVRALPESFFSPGETEVREAGSAPDPAYEWKSDPDEAAFVFERAGIKDDCLRRWKLKVDAKGSVEILPVAGGEAYTLEKAARFGNGLTVLPPLPREESDLAVTERDWLTSPAVPAMREFQWTKGVAVRLACHIDWNPLLQAEIDLKGLACDLLDDDDGRAWGEHLDRIKINHFVYRRAPWVSRRVGKSGLQSWRGGPLRRMLEAYIRPASRNQVNRIREASEHLESWQARRDWIYRQFPEASRVAPGSRRVSRHDYRPQPFEQVILVARAEGREDVALKFEVLRSRIEWLHFDQRIRWVLAPFGLIVAALWLIWQGQGEELTWAALVITLPLMIRLSTFEIWLRPYIRNHRMRIAALYVALCLPAAVLLIAVWRDRPFHFLVALVIFGGIRLAAFITDYFMWLGTGYLRKPISAFVMLVLAFLVGWLGVNAANSRDMLVVETQPVATLAAPDEHVEWPQKPPPPYAGMDKAIVMGTARSADEAVFREIPCNPGLSEPLYALDTLIPLVDLHEESRCSVRRLPIHWPGQAEAEADLSCAEARKSDAQIPVSCMNWGELATTLPARALDSHRFWWWMKALYAIAGWFIVSLALLTFAQVNRTRGEFAEE